MKSYPSLYRKYFGISLFAALALVSSNAFSNPPCGAVMATHKGEPARSNGDDMWSWNSCGGDGGTYGDRYQCPELIRRFYARVLDERTSSWHGNAVTYYSKADDFGLERYPNGGSVAPQVDDIVVFSGSDAAGHVAVVKSVGSTTVTIIEQNWSLTGTRDLIMSRNSGRYTLTPPRGNYQVLGWLRKTGEFFTPQRGYFAVRSGDNGEAEMVRFYDKQPFDEFSRTSISDFSTTGLDLEIVENADGSVLITMTASFDIDQGGSSSGYGFDFKFDLVQEVTYEIFGGLNASYGGTPERWVQFQTDIQFNALTPWDVLYFEEDNTISDASVNFTFNDTFEGDVHNNEPSEGSRNGVLTPGRFNMTGGAFIFSRAAGFAATGTSEISLKLTPVGN